MPQRPLMVYIGTYTDGEGQGVYVGHLDLATGRLDLVGTADGVKNPSFLVIEPRRLCLYAVQEVSDYAGLSTGAVSAFKLDYSTGQPTLVNTVASGGADPCYVSVDREGHFILVANYGGGSVALLPIREDGSLAGPTEVVVHHGTGADPERQDRPHAHSIRMDPGNRYALAADLGADRIMVYAPDPIQGKLTPHEPPSVAVKAGAGPRHLAFHPDARFVYVLTELASTLIVWEYDGMRGRLREVETVSALPTGFAGRSLASDVHVHPSGRFLYAANRGHDSIALFTTHADTGRLALHSHVPSGGRNPRSLSLDPTGQYLLAAHQDSNSVVTFRIDPDTGAPTPTGHETSVPKPVCVQMMFLPA